MAGPSAAFERAFAEAERLSAVEDDVSTPFKSKYAARAVLVSLLLLHCLARSPCQRCVLTGAGDRSSRRRRQNQRQRYIQQTITGRRAGAPSLRCCRLAPTKTTSPFPLVVSECRARAAPRQWHGPARPTHHMIAIISQYSAKSFLFVFCLEQTVDELLARAEFKLALNLIATVSLGAPLPTHPCHTHSPTHPYYSIRHIATK
jgi:hypothetical protein